MRLQGRLIVTHDDGSTSIVDVDYSDVRIMWTQALVPGEPTADGWATWERGAFTMTIDGNKESMAR